MTGLNIADHHLQFSYTVVTQSVSYYPARARAQRACALRALGLLLADGAPTVHNVYFVKYDVTVSFMAQLLDTVTYFVPQVLDTAS